MPRWTSFEPYFWSLVKKTSGCWIWEGGRDGKGYGRVWHEGKRKGAHRVAYELVVGKIPTGMCACHHCDNPICVNPEHIFIGTHKDNMRDCTAKSRNTLINNRELWSNGKHMRRKDIRENLSRLRKEEWESGKRIALRDKKGRIMGTKMV